MKITVDITTKTIKIHGSFKYEDYFEMYKQLPEDWKSFEFEVVPVEVKSSTVSCSCGQISLFQY